ncbi:hypothetical protein EOD39_7760 [Acipenser ruthenus]|uniref:Uncharacterized protein n=1 Tax=Acipenser ruthenus TaxID=7906 RepID=A0A662YXA6_ACIRT|nr:hypothetical protein EOD39_7760 [Acipenser ruthenus]
MGRWCARPRWGERDPTAAPRADRPAGERLTFIAPRGFGRARRLARVLDSLVRVSRRVGWGADVAADPWRRVGAWTHPARRRDAVGPH